MSIRLVPLQHLFSGTSLLQSNGTRSTLTIWDLIKTLENPGGRASGEELHAFMLEMFGEVERPFRGTTRTAGPQCAGTEHRRSVLDYSPDVPPCWRINEHNSAATPRKTGWKTQQHQSYCNRVVFEMVALKKGTRSVTWAQWWVVIFKMSLHQDGDKTAIR